MSRALLLLLAPIALAGCADLLRGEGDETLVVRNADDRAVNMILSIEQVDGGIRIFAREIFLEVGEEREYDLTMRPGEHIARVTTSTRLQETLPLEIPERGDTSIEVEIRRGAASLTVTH